MNTKTARYTLVPAPSEAYRATAMTAERTHGRILTPPTLPGAELANHSKNHPERDIRMSSLTAIASQP